MGTTLWSRVRGGALALSACLVIGNVVEASGRWLHVRIQDGRSGGEAVSLNIPLSLVESMLPMIASESFRDGRISLDSQEIDGIDLREVLAALRTTADGDFITVRGPEESVRVAKERGYLVIRADDGRRDRGNQVRLRLPIEVVEAMLRNDSSELDLRAGLRTLAKLPGEDLLSVTTGDDSVRIWIDSREEGER
jgi:hypothetical protein